MLAVACRYSCAPALAVPSLRLAVINFLLRTATFRHLNGHRRD
jgi:hypothetical protein